VGEEWVCLRWQNLARKMVYPMQKDSLAPHDLEIKEGSLLKNQATQIHLVSFFLEGEG
jgi:hypothetical protein